MTIEEQETMDSLSRSVTAMAEVIDPKFQHGPETEKLCDYGRETRRLTEELVRAAIQLQKHLEMDYQETMMGPNENQQRRNRDWSLLGGQVVGAEVLRPCIVGFTPE